MPEPVYQNPSVPSVPTPPKRGFPKILLVIVIAALIGALAFALWKVIPGLIGRGETELTWWGLWEDENIVTPIIEEYQQANPKVKIKYVRQSKEDYRERLTNALAKGTGPDIFRLHNTWIPMFKGELDQMPASVMSASDFAQAFYPSAVSDLTSGAGIVGIPLEYDALTLYINEDIFSQAGKNPPTTWDDLRSLAIELTRKDDQGVITQAGVALGNTKNVDHWPEILGLMMLQNGVDLTKPSGKLAEDALSFYTLFTNVDRVWDESLPSSTQAFAAGKVAMYFGPSWRAFNIIDQSSNKLKFKTVPLPQLPKSTPDEPNIAYATYWVEGVWARSKNKNAAWDFLKFMSSKETLEKLYANSAKTRAFGEPYPRREMAELLVDHPLIGSVITLAPDGVSWYLASRTFDGPTGINSQINKYFEDAINAVNKGTTVDKALEPVAAGINQVLSQYGLISQ